MEFPRSGVAATMPPEDSSEYGDAKTWKKKKKKKNRMEASKGAFEVGENEMEGG